MNKKAQEKYLSIWNILAWIGIAGVIALGISFYEVSQTDVRTEEAKIINQKIMDCLVEYDGTLKYNLNESFDIFRECSLNEKLFEEELIFFAKVEAFPVNEETSETALIELKFGNGEFDIQCNLKDENLARCYKQETFVEDKKARKDYLLKIKTGSNNKGGK